MQGFASMLNTQLMLFLLLGIGVLTKKLGIIDGKVRAALSDLVIRVVLPCNIVTSFMMPYEAKQLFSLGAMLLASGGIQLFCMGLNAFLFRAVNERKRSVLQYATVCSNAAFLGSPVAESIYGLPGLMYASVYLLPMRVAMWSVGLTYYTGKGRLRLRQVLLHPCIVATVVGFALLLTGWRPPVFITNTLSSVGGCTTALSMLVIGHILGGAGLKGTVTKGTMLFAAFRLLALPLLVLLALRLAGADALVTGVAVVLTGMPAGTSTAILADMYGGDTEYASKLVFVTTLLSMVTVPLLVLLMNGTVGT